MVEPLRKRCQALMVIRSLTALYLAISVAMHPLVSIAAESRPPDVTPPEIVHAPLAEFPPGVPPRILATVTDNDAVAEVVLLYRSAGEADYRRIRMMRTPGTDIYSAELPVGVGPRVEYIIQAADVSGNRVLGQLFDPYVTIVRPASAPPNGLAISPPTPTRAERGSPSSTLPKAKSESSGIGRWVWIGLGVAAMAVAAGSLAGKGGGGGGSNAGVSGGSNSDTGKSGGGGGIDNLGGTGTVIISAPVP
jgi:hypothetical protein